MKLACSALMFTRLHDGVPRFGFRHSKMANSKEHCTYVDFFFEATHWKGTLLQPQHALRQLLRACVGACTQQTACSPTVFWRQGLFPTWHCADSHPDAGHCILHVGFGWIRLFPYQAPHETWSPTNVKWSSGLTWTKTYQRIRCRTCAARFAVLSLGCRLQSTQIPPVKYTCAR